MSTHTERGVRTSEAPAPSPSAEPELILFFEQLNRSSLAQAGGKAANLGELTRAGFPVPPGFCVTTAAYDAVVVGSALAEVLAELADAAPVPETLGALAGRAREELLRAPVPPEVETAVRAAYAALCVGRDNVPVAVRSSATAEDLPDASFAGQQDTYLNIVGADAVVDAVRRCWASLWTDRAVAYRVTNAIDHRAVKLSAVVQTMVASAVSGVLFTANPLTNRRRQAVIDAVPGLGEALVSGMVNPDHLVVELDPPRVVERTLAARQLAIVPRAEGGTEHVALAEQPGVACLRDDQALALALLGARIEEHYQAPQDIEWALDDQERLWIVQSRPITTLFPLPDRVRLEAFQVYFSFNMAQGVLQPLTPMGADAARRVGIGVARLFDVPVDPLQGPAVAGVAAGRLFLEITPLLRRSWGRGFLTFALSHMEPRSGEALREVLDDPRLGPARKSSPGATLRTLLRLARRTKIPLRLPLTFALPAVERRAARARVHAFLRRAGRPVRDPEEALERAEWLLQHIVPNVMVQLIPSALMAGLSSFGAIKRLAGSLATPDDFQLLTRGLPHNVTTEMNLLLWGISRRLRARPADARLIVETPPPALAQRYLAGMLPRAIQREVAGFLRRYGFRGVAEIDLGVPRWSDDPTHIFGMLANYLRMDDPALAPDLQFQRAAAEAEAAMERLVAAARASGPLGALRGRLLRFFYARVRELMGTRESPKFYAVASFGLVRTLLKIVGEELVRQGRLAQVDDIFFLSVAEARDGLYGRDLRARVAEQRAAYQRESKRRHLPRLLLSDGTALYGESPLPEGLAAGSLVGSPASPGSYTGIARVIMDPAGARLDPGEILVAPSTDPGWTPLFMTAGALVMEMGGMMSHGSVVAREYGIPAVVGVLGATSAIQSGQRITVDGERGLVLVGAGS